MPYLAPAASFLSSQWIYASVLCTCSLGPVCDCHIAFWNRIVTIEKSSYFPRRSDVLGLSHVLTGHQEDGVFVFLWYSTSRVGFVYRLDQKSSVVGSQPRTCVDTRCVWVVTELLFVIDKCLLIYVLYHVPFCVGESIPVWFIIICWYVDMFVEFYGNSNFSAWNFTTFCYSLPYPF